MPMANGRDENMEMEKEIEKKVVRHETTPTSGSFEEYKRYYTTQEGPRRKPSAGKEKGVFSRYG